MPQQTQSAATRTVPGAACDRALPATQCLAWHVQPRIPGAKLSDDGRVLSFRCPVHDDRKASAAILVGDTVALNATCHACGKEAKLEVRAALIRLYGINPKCLPLSRDERAELETMIDAAFRSGYVQSTKLICIRAIHDGIRGPLPRAPALVELAERAGVSRRAAFRAAADIGGLRLDNLLVAGRWCEVKNTNDGPAIRGLTSVPDWHSLPDWHSDRTASVPNWHRSRTRHGTRLGLTSDFPMENLDKD